MNLALALAIFVGAALISGLLVEVIRRWMLRRERFDHPNERSSHTVPTPRGGGLAIVVVTLSGWILINVFVWRRFDWSVWAYPLGAGLIAAVSWIDDLRPLSNSVRFGVHTFGALVAISAYSYWTEIALPGLHFLQFGVMGVGATLLWIVWLTNAYNFMDGIDGIAGLQALVAGLGWLGISCFQATSSGFTITDSDTSSAVYAVGIFIAGCSLGFLVHNWPPARIFMGDVGSAFLGYSFAIVPLLMPFPSRVSGSGEPDSLLFLPAALLVWPFLFDDLATDRTLHYLQRN